MGVGPLAASKLSAVAVLLGCAALEVAGDAVIRRGLRGGGIALAALGCAVLGAYGILVNLLDIEFSKVLGAYVGLFALVSVLAGRMAFGDRIPASTWIGLAVILVGSAIVHLGPSP